MDTTVQTKDSDSTVTSSHNNSNENGYSWQVGSVYVFNVMVTTSVLTLPKVFAAAGWFMGLILLVLLAFMSYCTSTFVVETHSIHNAILRRKWGKSKLRAIKVQRQSKKVSFDDYVVENKHAMLIVPMPTADSSRQQRKTDDGCTAKQETCDDTTKSPRKGSSILSNIVVNHENLYEITEKAELGDMCKMFFNRAAYLLYYVFICLYLYGTLSSYFAAVATSFTSVVCGDSNCFDDPWNATMLPCLYIKGLTVVDVYRISLTAFTFLCCPFVFLEFQSTKTLQIFTTIIRWFLITSMVILAIIKMIKRGELIRLKKAELKSLPDFIGVALFAFMCQHSIPNVITPITDKSRLKKSLVYVYLSVLLVNILIAITAAFAFQEDNIHDSYTRNFPHPLFFKYIFQLFPVTALSTNIPIIGITLRENLKPLISPKTNGKYSVFVRGFVLPLLVVTPSLAIAFSTSDVSAIVGTTGAYAGTVIQYVVPSTLVYCARKKAISEFGSYQNVLHRSTFHHDMWIPVVLIWCLCCLVLVTYYKAAFL